MVFLRVADFKRLNLLDCLSPINIDIAFSAAVRSAVVMSALGLSSVIVRVSSSANSATLGLSQDSFFFLKDLITDESFVWRGNRNFVRLDPAKAPGHLLVLKKI